jgi:2-phospho-L-lactate guanylyltransferase
VNAVWAVVPGTGGEGAKQRLAPALGPEARRALALAMAERVLAALAGAPSIAGTVVVTDDAPTVALATRMRARVCREGAGAGHDRAVAAGVELLMREGREAMLCLPGDLPLVTSSDIELVVAARRGARDFVIVPARDRGGTNGVLCAPPDVIPLRFGHDSFPGHLASARETGIEPTVLHVAGIAFDVDVPRDLEEPALQSRFGELLPRP